MVDSIFIKIREAFNFTLKEFLFIILLVILTFFTINTNHLVNGMDQRYYFDIQENAASVLTTLQKNNIIEPNDILDFLSQKPAGKSDLKKGVTTERTYILLVEQYGVLAKNARIVFQ